MKKIKLIKLIFVAIMLLLCSVSKSQVSFVQHQLIGLGNNLMPSAVMVDAGNMDSEPQNEVVVLYVVSDTMKLGICKINNNPLLTTVVTYQLASGINVNWRPRQLLLMNASADNRMDIVYAHRDSITIMYQKQSGSFGLDSSVTFYSGIAVNGLAKADFDHDGNEDFVASHSASNYLSLYIQTTSGFTVSHIISPLSGDNQLKVYDVNNDGWSDLCFLAGQGLSSGVYIYINDMTGYFTTTPQYIYLTDPDTGITAITNSFSAGNFLGIGNEFFLSPLSSTLSCNIFTSTGMLDQIITLPPFGKSSNAADLNNDGKDELVALTNSSGERLMVIEFTPSLTVHPYPTQISGNFHDLDQAIACENVVGNSGLDIITISDWGGVTIWENQTPTDVAIIEDITQINIYPNPATDDISIVDLAEGSPVKIIDLSGRIVLDGFYHGTIDVHGIASGVYCLYVTIGGKAINKKLIVQ